MRRLLRKWFSFGVSVVATGLALGAAEAASITSEAVNGITFLVVSGELERGDEKKFVDLALSASRAIVFFNSPGGALKVGIEIGSAIRLKGFATAVPGDATCASACAIAWLGGTPRFLEPSARVGFHAAYIQENGQKLPTAVGNALVGAYVSKLGLSDRAVEYMTSAPPDGVQWLTLQDAQMVGIAVTEFKPKETSTQRRPESTEVPSKPALSQPAETIRLAREAFAQEDFSRAAELLSPLAAAGDPVASSRLADLLENGSGVPKDLPRAIDLVKRAAEAGHACAKSHLGDFYESGLIGQKNMGEAVRWWKLCADGGCPFATVHLGLAYRDGSGVARDITAAMRWFERAASEGMWDGNVYLAVAYRRGEIAPLNLGLAAYYYRRSAMLDHENSQYRLALLYRDGSGLPKDIHEAYIWTSIAAQKGEPEPIRLKKALAKTFTEQQLKELDELARRRSEEIARNDRSNTERVDEWLWKIGR